MGDRLRGWIGLVVLVAAGLIFAGCCPIHIAVRSCHRADMKGIKRRLLPATAGDVSRAFVERTMMGGTRRFRVFIPRECFPQGTPTAGNWPRADLPPILLCHEFITLGPDTLELAQRLARHGYAVYVPVLFGNEREDPVSVPLAIWRGIDFRFFEPEWRANVGMGSRPIADELGALCREEIGPRHPGKRLGVIGLCMSGMLPVELLGQDQAIPHYAAVVVNHPVIPVCAGTAELRGSLGLSQEELGRARERASREGVAIQGFRFERDLLSPKEKFVALKASFGERFLDETLPARDYIGRDHYPVAAHAVLTDGFRPWLKGERETRAHFAHRQLLWYLDWRLKGEREAAPRYEPERVQREEDPAERVIVGCEKGRL